jgi:hypothetical protein
LRFLSGFEVNPVSMHCIRQTSDYCGAADCLPFPDLNKPCRQAAPAITLINEK